jgi:hypothetical protein
VVGGGVGGVAIAGAQHPARPSQGKAAQQPLVRIARKVEHFGPDNGHILAIGLDAGGAGGRRKAGALPSRPVPRGNTSALSYPMASNVPGA